MKLGEYYSSATGDLKVYYTNSLGLERGGLGGGSSSKAQYSEGFKISLDNQNPKQQIQLQDNYTIAVLSKENINTTVKPKDSPIIPLIIMILGSLMVFSSIILMSKNS